MADDDDFNFGPVTGSPRRQAPTQAQPQAQPQARPKDDNDLHFGAVGTNRRPPAPPPNSSGPSPETPDAEGYLPERPSDRSVLSNQPREGDVSGTLKNLGTTVLKGASHIPGLFGDLVETLKYGEAGVRSLTSNKSWQQVLQEINAQQEHARANGQWQPMTGEEIFQRYVKPRTGEYEPTSEFGKAGRSIGEGAVAGLVGGPGGALAGGSGGLAGFAGEHFTQNPYHLMALSILGGAAPSTAKWAVGKVKGQPIPEGQQKAAALKLLENYTENPEKAWEEMQKRKAAGLPDEPTAQASLDPGHALAQDVVTSQRHPDMMDSLQRERLTQNEGTGKALGNLAPSEAEPGAVSAGFLKRLQSLQGEQETQGSTLQAPPEGTSASGLRGIAKEQHDFERERLDQLKATIDPENVLQTPTPKTFAAEALQDLAGRPYKGRSAVADEFYQTAAKMPDMIPLRDMMDFDQNLTAAMRTTMGKDPAGYNQLRELKGKVKEALKNTIEKEHNEQQGKVARGELSQEGTRANSLAASDREWWAEHDARQRAAASGESQRSGGVEAGSQTTSRAPGAGENGPAGAGAGRPGVVHPENGGVAQGEPGQGAATLSGGLSSNEAGSAVDRLREFNRRWGEYKDTFSKGPVGEALKTEFGGQNSKLDADVAAKAFASGPKGFELANMWLKAGGENPEALARLKDLALGRLQAELKGKPLDAQSLTAFTSKYSDALRAISAQDPTFISRFDQPAAATAAVAQFEKSAAAKFMKLEHPDTIVAQMGAFMKARDGAERISELMRQAQGLPDEAAIVAGMRKAGSTWLTQEFRTAGRLPGSTGSEVPVFRGADLRDFINERRNVLDSLFEPEAVNAVKEVADGMGRSKMVQTMQNVQHGSQTAGRLGGIEQQKRMLGKQIAASLAQDAKGQTASMFSGIAAFEMGRELLHVLFHSGSPIHIAEAGGLWMIGKAWRSALEKAGAAREGQQHAITDLAAKAFASRDFALALKEQALNEHGVPNQQAFDKLARMVVGYETAQQGEQERQRRARGGRVHDLANGMIEAVETARKMQARESKPILQQPDNVVAQALAIAGRHS